MDISVVQMDSVIGSKGGKPLFKKLFPVILTDNGSEFSNPRAIEYSDEKFTGLRTNVFYCDAGSPYQKGAIGCTPVAASDLMLKPALLKK